MTDQQRRQIRQATCKLRALVQRCLTAAAVTHRRCQSHWRPFDSPAVIVLIVDPNRRARLEQEVGRAARRLTQALGPPLAGKLTVIVQQSVREDTEVRGACDVTLGADRRRVVLVRLALQVGAEFLNEDELLATLAEVLAALSRAHPIEANLRFSLGGEPPLLPEASALFAVGNDPLFPASAQISHQLSDRFHPASRDARAS